MLQDVTSKLYWDISRRVSDRESIRLLKRRRDDLLNRACSRSECAVIMEEVQQLNREIDRLERGLGRRR